MGWCTVTWNRLLCKVALLSQFFFAFNRTSKISMMGLNQVWGMMTHIRKVRKSQYGLKFGGMMECTMKWITIWNGHVQPMLAFLAATKQLYDWFSPSVRPSVRPSVCPSVTPFSPCSHHRIIMKLSGVITMVKSDVHAKGQGQRSKVKVTEVNTQLSRFRTLTPVWIHIWQWNYVHSWKQHRRGALLVFKVIRQISRSHGSKNRRILPKLGVSGL